MLGLLTGNVRSAQHKLGHFGLWDYFVCGGFGDEHYERDDVARLAIVEVRAHLGRLRSRRGLGDRRYAARRAMCPAVGARAVAVATGWHPIEELAEHKPDFLLADLSDAQELLRAWT